MNLAFDSNHFKLPSKLKVRADHCHCPRVTAEEVCQTFGYRC